MPTAAEKTAAYAAASSKALALIKRFVPPMFERQAEKELNEHPEYVTGVVDAALAAAEAARAPIEHKV